MKTLRLPSSTRWPAAAGLVLALAACGERPAQPWSGYAEAEFVHVAAPLAGTLGTLSVQPGQKVTRGSPLFTLESEAERAAREEAEAQLAAARFQAANAGKGRRPSEVAVTEAQLRQARAQAELARSDYTRKRELVDKGFISAAQLDESRAAQAQAQARVAELESALQVARLPARSDEQAAAQAQAEAARQALRQNDWRVQQKAQAAPVDALVSDTYFRPGEFVGAGQPVVALLPAGQVKARFFVAESELASLPPGRAVEIRCDGCGAPIAARVSRVATEPEYTPPVIYSNAQRAKLVFMIEARPAPADAARLHPGQPLDVRLAAGVAR